MTPRILVVIPSRDRPQELAKAVNSIVATASDPGRVRVAPYVDEDQAELYASHGLEFFSGPRVGPAPAIERIVAGCPDFDLYGSISDDSVITSPGWDRWVLDTVSALPHGIAVLSPSHNLGPHVDFPFVTRKWLDAVGWFAAPGFQHFGWPLVIHMTALAAGVPVIDGGEHFRIRHDQRAVVRGQDFFLDAVELHDFLVQGLHETASRVAQGVGQ